MLLYVLGWNSHSVDEKEKVMIILQEKVDRAKNAYPYPEKYDSFRKTNPSYPLFNSC